MNLTISHRRFELMVTVYIQIITSAKPSKAAKCSSITNYALVLAPQQMHWPLWDSKVYLSKHHNHHTRVNPESQNYFAHGTTPSKYVFHLVVGTNFSLWFHALFTFARPNFHSKPSPNRIYLIIKAISCVLMDWSSCKNALARGELRLESSCISDHLNIVYGLNI